MLSFKNKKFKIMQIADIQEDVPLNEDTLKLISLAVKKEKPDLVVLTGDQIQGYSSCYKKDSKLKVKECIDAFVSPLEKDNIPFCMTFGNHDDDCKVSKRTQVQLYHTHSNFIMGESHSPEDPATYSLQIFDSNKVNPVFNLYLIDSNKKENDGTYSPVKKEQIEWYRRERERLKERYGDYLPSFVFQHIPVPEYYNCLVKHKKRIKGSVEAFKSRKNTFWTLPEKALKNGGFMYESPAVPEINNGEFDAIKEKGDVIGLFTGHDHNNSYIINYEGIDLGYCQGAGFNTYGPSDKRGVRIYVLNEDNIKNYKSYTVTMGELCDYKPSKPFKEFIFRNMPSSVDQAISDAKRIGKALAITVLIAVSAIIILK